MSLSNYGKIPYYKISKLLWNWTLRDGENGCRIMPNVTLSMDKAPPTLRDQPPPPPAPKEPPKKKEAGDALLGILEASSRFKKWLDTPDPPKQPKSAKQEKIEAVPPFDIQEIPGGMRAASMPVAAKLMEKWFAGRLNYSPDDAAEQAMLNQDGKPYPPSMIDTTTIKMGWVLGYVRAKEGYERLVNTAIYNDLAKAQIIKKLTPYLRNSSEVSPWRECDDLATLHKRFQFQRVWVDGTIEQKFSLFLRELSRGTPDDTTGALGSFNFYAAIAKATIDRDSGKVTVTHISVYVKDNYTFNTDPGEASQYLGHWSAKGVIVVPVNIAAQLSRIDWVEFPVAVYSVGGKYTVYYPVKNKTFRDWQIKHRQGGDFIIYSDCKHIRLQTPITVYFK